MTEFVIRRIVVACDAVSENPAGIEAAAQLAKSWHALLHAVFVQDEGLLHLAALPFARQTGAAGMETLDEMELQRQFEVNAARTRTVLEAAARANAVISSFAVVRGRTAVATLPLGDRDLLVVLATTRPFAGQFRLASPWLSTVLEAQLPVLLLRDRAEWVDGIVYAVWSAKPSSMRALQAAAALAVATDQPLIVKILDGVVQPDDVRKWLGDIVPGLADRARIESVRAGWRLDEGEKSLLVLDAASDSIDLAALKQMVEHSAADILFVR